jgi:SSS family transporter
VPLLDRPLIAVVAGVYLASVVAIGLFSLRRTRDARDFFIAGGRLGLWVTALATMSAAFSGFIFLGGPGLAYRMGLASLWIVLPVGLTAGMLCWALGGRLQRLAARREVYTIPDALALRFDERTRGLAALAVAVGSVAYLGLQLQAAGVLIQAVFGLDSLLAAIAVALGVLLLYSALGGMVAGVYTDVLQGGMMLAVAVSVFFQAIRVAGGWTRIAASIRDDPRFGAGFLEPFGSTSWFTAFGFFFVFGVGVLGQPQMLHKFYMLRDAAKLRYMPLVLGASQSLCLLIWVGIGVAVPALVAQGRMAAPQTPDRAAPDFLLAFAPDALAGLAIAGILAAIMSTADSFINIGSAALVRDLPRALARPLGDELRWGRIAVLAIGGLAAAAALLYGDLIALLGTFAFGTFAAALAPATVVGLGWAGATAPAARISIAGGLFLNLGLEWLQRHPPGGTPPLPPGVLPSAVALAGSFLLFIVVSLLTRPADPASLDEEVRRMLTW